MTEKEIGCDNCYYSYFDEKAYPCSLCIRGVERTDMWQPSKKTKADCKTEPITHDDYIETENDHLEARCLNCNNAKACKEKHWDGCVYEPNSKGVIEKVVETIQMDIPKQADDLISRADAIKAIEELPNAYNGWSDAYDKAYIIGTLEEVPSAQPKQGEWVAVTKDYLSRWECSLCGKPALLDDNEQMELSKFCPNCGARMTERSE